MQYISCKEIFSKKTMKKPGGLDFFNFIGKRLAPNFVISLN